MRRSLLAVAIFTLGCSSESLKESDTGSPRPGEEPPQNSGNPGQVVTRVRVGRPVPLFERAAAFEATALAFDPLRSGELWVTLRQPTMDAPCTADVGAGCSALIGVVALIAQATGAEPKPQVKQDGNAWHFMRRPTSIAFGDNGNFATCGEARTDNYTDERDNYAGPTLWSSDPLIFGVEPEPGQNGTHLDMLHESPFCMGIAHERDNVYWAFNGERGALDRYDFKIPHPIGGDDHSDGELHRHLEGELLRVPEVPSHLAVDRARGLIYAADTGHARLLRVDIASGTADGEVPSLDRLAVRVRMSGTAFRDFGSPGLFTLPSGVALAGDRIFVTDNATGNIHVLDSSGAPVERIETGLPAGALSGITMGPDQKLYVSDLRAARAYRIELD